VPLSKTEIRKLIYQFVTLVKVTMTDKFVIWWSNWRRAHQSIAMGYHKKMASFGV